MSLAALSNYQSPHDSSITEIILPKNRSISDNLVLPMLAHISHQCTNRWLTWIAPQHISKYMLAPYGFASKKVRMIHSHCDAERIEAALRSLEIGNSEVVAACLEHLPEAARSQLERASAKGKTRGIVLYQR